MNIIPAFMPPTWTVLAFLYIHYHLSFFPTVILGVLAATGGRIILALIAGKCFKKFLPERFLQNYIHLGNYLKKNQKITVPVVLGYAFSPITSNSLFIVAGLSNLPLNIISFSFFIGRIFSYSFWILTSHHIAKRLDDIFVGNFSSINAFVATIIPLVVVFIIGKINWRKILKIRE